MLWFVTHMKNRRWLFSVGLMLGVAATLSAATPPAKPNFIIILADDLGYGDVGPFGSKLNRTPHLDRMAEQGMKLTSFYAAPVCTPSRSQMMSGCYAKRVSLPNVIFPSCPIGLNTNEATLPRLLHQQGYATMAIGKWHLGDQREFLPTRHGFDHYFGLPYSNDMGPAEEKAALRDLQRAQAAAAATNAPANAGTAAGTNARPAAAQAPSPTNYLGITRGRKPPLPLVPQVPFANRHGGVSLLMQESRQGGFVGVQADRARREDHVGQRNPLGVAAAHHLGSRRRADRRGVETRQLHALLGHAVQTGCAVEF